MSPTAMAAGLPWSGLLCGTAVMLAACAPASPATPRVGRAVTDAINATGGARVLVTLRDPIGSTASAAEREAAVSAAQDAVIARLPTGQFRVIRRYRSVPGLALAVTQQALDVLRSDPRVTSIEIDEAGGASEIPRRPTD